MNYYERRQIEASANLAAMLDLPPIPQGGEMYSDGECFNPWDLFPCLYGSYSSDFDEMAIAVLTDIRDGTYHRTDLAAEMFREILCAASLCDYGTSPRVCFASTQFASLLPRLIERWQEYAAIRWQD